LPLATEAMKDNIASGQSYLPTLVVDGNGTAATQLADQLSRCGFSADVATNWPTAHAAAHSRHEGSLVVVADPRLPLDLECLARLRRTSPRTWIIVVSSTTQHTVPQ
jgi:DNA-binding response OmpR family regulator